MFQGRRRAVSNATPASVTAHEMVTAALRGEAVGVPSVEEAAAVGQLARVHGVRSLLHHRLSTTADWQRWPEDLRNELMTAARQQVAAELVRRHELAEVLAMLNEVGVDALVLKGAALAYTVYEESSTRERGDSDVLVPKSDAERAADALRRLDYEPTLSAGGELASYQQTYRGRLHSVDLHWEISNAQLFASALEFDDLAERSMAVPALGPHARALCPTDALLHALVHRATHVNAPYYVDGVGHHEHNRLIWLYDIHLLATGLADDAWRDFENRATRHQIRAVCLDGLLAAREAFATALPEELVRRWESAGWSEPSAGYLRVGRLHHTLVELKALPTWSKRIRLVRDVVLPEPEYMLDKYGTRRRALLPWLYLRRALGGLYRAARSKR